MIATVHTDADARQFIISQVKPEETIVAMPYTEAVKLAKAIISDSAQPSLKFVVRHDIYEMIEWEGRYEVRITTFNPCVTTTAYTYSTFLAALAELQRAYHMAVGWSEGLNPLFVPENDHQANGQKDRQMHEIRVTADLGTWLWSQAQPTETDA